MVVMLRVPCNILKFIFNCFMNTLHTHICNYIIINHKCSIIAT